MGRMINVLAVSAAALAQPTHQEAVGSPLTTVMSEVKAQTGMEMVITDSQRDPHAQELGLLNNDATQGWSFVVTDGSRPEKALPTSSSTHITGRSL
jgi:hypothetical protein